MVGFLAASRTSRDAAVIVTGEYEPAIGYQRRAFRRVWYWLTSSSGAC